MFCPSCGSQTADGTAFCSSCGHQLGGAIAAGGPAPTALLVGAIICAVISVIFIPPLFGAIAIYLGYRLNKQGSPAGVPVMIGAGIAMAIGMVIGAIVWSSAA